MMTVRMMQELLEGMNPDCEIRFASQPNYPFEYEISCSVGFDNIDCAEDEEDVDGSPVENRDEVEDAWVDPTENWNNKDNANVVWLSEERQIGYLSSDIAQQLNWRN